jgi:hypothetical protein
MNAMLLAIATTQRHHVAHAEGRQHQQRCEVADGFVGVHGYLASRVIRASDRQVQFVLCGSDGVHGAHFGLARRSRFCRRTQRQRCVQRYAPRMAPIVARTPPSIRRYVCCKCSM